MPLAGGQRRCRSCTPSVKVAVARALQLAWLLVLCCAAQEADQAAGSAAHGSTQQHAAAGHTTAEPWQRCPSPSHTQLVGSLQLALQALVESGADRQVWSNTLKEQAAQQHMPAAAGQAHLPTAATDQVASSRRLLARSNGTSTRNSSDAAASSGRHAVAAALPAQRYTAEHGHEGQHNVQLPQSPAHPFTMVGQLDNGCSGFLVGPCHVITVAHCVYSPELSLWWPGLAFSPARNGRSSWSPHGTTGWRHAEVPDRWKATGDHRYDYAVVVTKQPIGRNMGYFDLQDPQQLLGSWHGTAGQQGQQGQQAVHAADQRSSPTPAAAAAAGLVLNIAGYPDDKPNGTLWYDHCGVLDWSFADGAYMVHGCAARGGNSGSALWLYDARDGSRRVVGLHVAGQEVQGRQGPREVHLAVPFTGEALRWVREVVARNAC